jgi:Flp pilus assembly protein TadG
MVEMIVMLPMLLFILFALVEISRAWFTLQIATTAAREGARAASVAPLFSEVSDGQARIDAMFTTAGITPSSRTVTKVAVAGTPDFEVVATVNVTFNTLFPILVPRLQTINMTERANMRYECNVAVTPCSPPP